MIVEINTLSKTIKVKGSVNLNELMTWLMTNFEFEWMNWTISEYPVVSAMDSWKGMTVEQPIYPGQGIYPLINPLPMVSPVPKQQEIWYGDDPNQFKTTCDSSSGTTGSTVTNGSIDRNSIIDNLVKKKLMT